MLTALNNQLLIKYLGNTKYPFTAHDFQKCYTGNTTRFSNQEQLLFVIDHNQYKQQIGCITLHIIPETENGYVGFWIVPQFWKSGFMTEALRRVTEYSFKELRMHKIYGVCVEENIGSEKVMTKCGYKQEGYFIEDLKIRGKYYTTKRFAILAA